MAFNFSIDLFITRCETAKYFLKTYLPDFNNHLWQIRTHKTKPNQCLIPNLIS